MTKKKQTHIEYLFDQINGGDCVDSAGEAQEIAEGLLRSLKECLVRLERLTPGLCLDEKDLARVNIARAESRS